jgi:ABC-type oligopeptide transport system ATPase subunit
VEHVGFEVGKGETVALVGQSGWQVGDASP